MVDLSRLMQDAATLEVIEKSAIEAQVLRHDVEAYRACLGYSVSGDHDGRLSDGTLPNNGIAEALDNECRTLSAQNSAQAMQIDELKRDLAAAQEALQRDNEGWQRTYDHDCAKLVERAQLAEADAERYRWLKAENSSMESWRASVRIALDAYTEETGHQGDELDAAIDAAIAEGKK